MAACRTWMAVALLALALAGCGSDDASDSEITDPDSLGLERIEIPENQPSLGAEPRLRLRQSYPPGRYTLHTTNHSVLRVSVDDKANVLEKEKEYWYSVAVSRPNSAGQVALRIQTTRAKYYRSDQGRRLDTDDPSSLAGDPAGQVLPSMLADAQRLVVDRDAEPLSLSGGEATLEGIRSVSPEAAQVIEAVHPAMRYQVHGLCFPAAWLLPKQRVGAGAVWHAERVVDIPGTCGVSTMDGMRWTVAACVAALAVGVAPCPGAGAAPEGVLAGAADPAIIAAPAGQKGYYVFATGRGLGVWHSTDLVRWRRVARVFATRVPDWAAKAVPGADGIWAPDISWFNGWYHLYYSVSTFGSQRSAIGLAVNKTLDPSDPGYRWEDRGMVIDSRPGRDNFNAIDPALLVDADGKAWLFWGSYWTGIKVAPVDKATGKPVAGAKVLPVASRGPRSRNTAIEGAYVIRRDGWYYLFVSWDFCLDGADSTYKVMVGRAKKVTGPYLDQKGRRMTDGGGTLVLAGYDRWAGPGHNSVLHQGESWWLVHHTYDKENLRAHRVLQIRPMYWPAAGWPVVGEPVGGAGAEPASRPPVARPSPAGVWRHWVDYGRPSEVQLLGGGKIAGTRGRWTLAGAKLTLTWPDPKAPGAAWVDALVYEPSGRSYVGRNQAGQVIHGLRK